MKDGILIVNKPNGITSHDVVSRIRRKFNTKRVGHAGTLDPLATGVLIILMGQGTKLFNEFVAFDKAYRSTLILGKTTNTADISGQVLKTESFEHISEEQIIKAFAGFKGDLQQVPPMVSAIKYKGKKLYEYARQGIEVPRQARHIQIMNLVVEKISLPEVQFYLECSKGTYVRQLAEDIGVVLGCGACITQIQRVKVGKFDIQDAVSIEDLNEGHIRSWEN